MATKNFRDSRTQKRLRLNVVGPHVNGFTAYLQEGGYKDYTICECLRAITHFGCWIQDEGIFIQDLNEDSLIRFQRHFPCNCFSRNCVEYSSIIGKVRHFIEYLRRMGFIENKADSREALEPPLVKSFLDWLRLHRGLKDSTLVGYRRVVIDLLRTIGYLEKKRNMPRICIWHL